MRIERNLKKTHGPKIACTISREDGRRDAVGADSFAASLSEGSFVTATVRTPDEMIGTFSACAFCHEEERQYNIAGSLYDWTNDEIKPMFVSLSKTDDGWKVSDLVIIGGFDEDDLLIDLYEPR